MKRNRVLVPFPPDVIAEVDRFVEPGQRTAFLVELARHELKLRRQAEALREAAGSWKDEDHPELAQGAAAWIEKIRAETSDRQTDLERQRKEILAEAS